MTDRILNELRVKNHYGYREVKGMNREAELGRSYISSEVRFYSVEDVVKLTGWSETIVRRLFNDPGFPSADFGRARLVEAHALIEYFSKKRQKAKERFWMKGDLENEFRRRIG